MNKYIKIIAIGVVAFIIVILLCSCSLDDVLAKFEELINGNSSNTECDHEFADWIGETTDCMEPFEATRTCTKCGYVESGTAYLDSHTIKTVMGKDSTCTEVGYTEEEYCTRCGKVYQEKIEIAKKEHTFVNGICSVCKLKAQSVYVDGVSKSSIPDGNNYVVYVRTENNDISLQYDYQNKKLVDNKNVEKYTLYFFSVSKLYSSVDEMIKSTDNYPEGTILGIKSYFDGVGRGASLYKVSSTKGNYYKTLKNGRYANLIPFTVESEKIITVDMFGAKGDGKTADNSAILNACAFTDYTELDFESDVYVQNSQLDIKNLLNKTINGRGARIENHYSGTSVVGNDVVFTSCTSVRVKYLEVYCSETKGQGTLYKAADHLQMRVVSSKNFTLDHVKITCPQNSTADRHIGSIWIRNTNNFIMHDCTIINLSNSTQNSAGVWISANENGSVSGFTFYNNYIEKNTHDEVFAFFIGTMTDIDIYNNTIKTHDEPTTASSAHAIGFGVNAIATTVKNAKFHDNVVDVVSTKDAIIFGTCENIDIYDNEITLRNNSPSQILEHGFFRVSEPSTTTQKNINIHDNELNIVSTAVLKNNYNVGNLFCNIRSGFSIYNNKIKVQGTLNKYLDGQTGAKIINNTITLQKAPNVQQTIDSSNKISW